MADKLITTQLEFEMTNYCNASCIFCPREDPRPKGFIEFDTIKVGVELAKNCGIKGFKISGFGEPTLHKNLVEYLHYIKQIPESKLLLITNGSLLGKELYDQLSKVPVDRINISFNGYDKKSYESQMKGLSFDRVIDNLKYVISSKREVPKIQFIPILSKSFTEEDVKRMQDFLRSIGFNEENFLYGLTITSRAGKLKDEGLIDETFIQKIGAMEITDKNKVICLANLNNLYISWQGNIHICCNDIYGEAVIGNIKELKTCNDLKDLERKNLYLRANYIMELCQKCDIPLTRRHVERDGRVYAAF